MDIELVERLQKLRTSLGLRQGKFAEKIGIPQTTYCTIEKGKSPLHERHIKLICLTFGVNDKWLRDGIGEMFLAKSSLIDELIRLLNQLSPQGQTTALALIRTLVEQEQSLQNKTPETIQQTFPVSESESTDKKRA
jgi:transcriptional regulator with XRE-family HTH domain